MPTMAETAPFLQKHTPHVQVILWDCIWTMLDLLHDADLRAAKTSRIGRWTGCYTHNSG